MGWTNWKGSHVKREAARGVSVAAQKTAEVIGEAADQQVPHDEGFLQDSKTIKADPQNPMNVQIGYGGSGSSGKALVPYAVRHHEIASNFQKGRKSQYLRDPVKSLGNTTFRKALKKELGDQL